MLGLSGWIGGAFGRVIFGDCAGGLVDYGALRVAFLG